MFTAVEELDQLAERLATSEPCPECCAPLPAGRIRCTGCKPSPYPVSYLVARARLARMVKR